MKVIFVSGDDFAALSFEEHYKGVPVQEIIDSGVTEVNEDDYFFEITVVEVGEVSDEFVNFVRNKMIDYDHGKNENFWLENEIV